MTELTSDEPTVSVDLNFEEFGFILYALMRQDDFRNAMLRDQFDHPALLRLAKLYIRLAAAQDTMR